MIKLIWTTVFLFSIPVSQASDIHDWDLITDQVMGGKSKAMINIKNWNYVSDNVMGGKSSGALTDNKKYISMQGNVTCLLYTSPSPRDRTRSRMPSSA